MVKVIIWFFFWIFLAITYYIVPGKVMKGTELKDGSRLDYRVNGLSSFVLLLITFYAGVYLGYYQPTVIYYNLSPLFTVANWFSFALVLFLYIKGKFFTDVTINKS